MVSSARRSSLLGMQVAVAAGRQVFWAPERSLGASCCQHCPRPKPAHPSAQSSCASRHASSSALPHPRCSARTCRQAGRHGARPGPRRQLLRVPLSPHPFSSTVQMSNPSVGLTVVISSSQMRLTTVVLPALSRPLHAGSCFKKPRSQTVRHTQPASQLTQGGGVSPAPPVLSCG